MHVVSSVGHFWQYRRANVAESILERPETVARTAGLTRAVCLSRISKLPQTQVEWAQLLEAQQRYHDAELQKWKEIIKSSVLLLDQVRGSTAKPGG